MPPLLNPVAPRPMLPHETNGDHPNEVRNRRLRIDQLSRELVSLGGLPPDKHAELQALQEAAVRHLHAQLRALERRAGYHVRVPPAPAE